ncbi:MAG: TolC family protein [Bacteriovorax sp.]|nr:TolC family protein [Bacteriovorax sp.]
MNKTYFIAKMLALTWILTSCKDGNLPNLNGRYQGFMTIGNARTQIVAQVPDFKKESKVRTLTFKIYPTLASSAGNQYSLTILDKETIELKSSQIYSGSANLNLNSDKNCVKGTAAPQTIIACWEQNKFTLSINDKLNPEKSILINLNLDKNLAPLEANKILSIDELVGRAKFNNYTVTEESERVFQAQKSIGVARGNLLPKLSLKSLLGLATGDYVSAVGTVLPFLFPGNWYKWEASKELYQAEKTSFATLRGNEMNMVEGLYYIILRDQQVLERLKKHITWMKQIQDTIKQSEKVGTVTQGTADYFGLNIGILERDKINFEALIKIQYAQLAEASALSPINGIAGLIAISVPDLSGMDALDPSTFFKEAQDYSYELKSLGFLLKAAKTSQKEIYFNFFDLEGNNGIGFGTHSQILVSKSQQEEISKKIDETKSLIELQSSMVANEYNQALDSYQLAESNKNTSLKRFNWLISRLLQGDGAIDSEEFVNELTDIQNKIIGFTADEATSAQMWLMAKSKLNRLMLKGYYSDLEAALPDEPIVKSRDENSHVGGN